MGDADKTNIPKRMQIVTKLKENKVFIKAADENFQNIHLHIFDQK